MPCTLQRPCIAFRRTGAIDGSPQVPLNAPSFRSVKRLFCEFMRLAYCRESLVDIADHQVRLGQPRQKAAEADVGLGSADLLDTPRHLGNGPSVVGSEADSPTINYLRQPTNKIEPPLLAACDGT